MMRDDEANFARRMAELRSDRGMSQSELARRMADSGFDSYSQMTVSRTEKGERPIRLGEARAIAEILDSRVEDMTRGSDLDEALDLAEKVKQALIKAMLGAAGALVDYREAAEWSGEASSRLRSYDQDAAREAIADLSGYVYPFAAVAAWAAEVASDADRDWPEAIDWKDLTRISDLGRVADGEHQAEA